MGCLIGILATGNHTPAFRAKVAASEVSRWDDFHKVIPMTPWPRVSSEDDQNRCLQGPLLLRVLPLDQVGAATWRIPSAMA